VDDGSADATAERAAEADSRVELVAHERNRGVDAAIVTGYRRGISDQIDVTCVMAEDVQTNPDDLKMLVHAVAVCEVDYAKRAQERSVCTLSRRLPGRTDRAARRVTRQLMNVRFLDGYRVELIEQRGARDPSTYERTLPREARDRAWAVRCGVRGLARPADGRSDHRRACRGSSGVALPDEPGVRSVEPA
jgi:glycosyltransferase involved in cell wall biosynthesis